MTDDRVYPASKPPTNGGAAAANPSFPATKAQQYGASRPMYRPQPHHHRGRRSHGRGRCCRCCCWTIFAVVLLVLLVAAAAAVVYLLYRPQRPSFAVSSLKISTLNVSPASHLTTSISLNVTARNPNKKVVFDYDTTTIRVLTDDDVSIGQGSFPAFNHGTKNTTLLRGVIGSPDQDPDFDAANKLKGSLKSKKGIGLKMVLDTKVRVKMGALKIPKTRIRVSCEGIKATAPRGKTATAASTSDAKCKVDLRFKIWKINF